MRTSHPIPFALALLAAGTALLLPPSARAFPPAPSHFIYGLVRDEQGTPLNGTEAKIILETSAGTRLQGALVEGEAGINYRLTVPMDSGITDDAYKPTALQPTAPFRLKVEMGGQTYLPLEMVADFSHLGQPAQSTRIDLTLGVDSDHDGLPDAWEQQLILKIGGTLADIRPGDDPDHDGLSNYAEYIAGTYAYDPKDGFALKIVAVTGGVPTMEFLTIRSRTYTVYGSSDLKTWTPVSFRLTSESSDAPARSNYQSTDFRVLRLNAIVPAESKLTFFKVKVQ